MKILKLLVDSRFADARPAEPWAVGDLAICLTDSWMSPCGHDPARDDLLRVAAVFLIPGGQPQGGVVLQFERRPQSHVWIAAGFRKPNLDRQLHEEEAEWVQRIRRAPADIVHSSRPFVTDELVERPSVAGGGSA